MSKTVEALVIREGKMVVVGDAEIFEDGRINVRLSFPLGLGVANAIDGVLLGLSIPAGLNKDEQEP